MEDFWKQQSEMAWDHHQAEDQQILLFCVSLLIQLATLNAAWLSIEISFASKRSSLICDYFYVSDTINK